MPKVGTPLPLPAVEPQPEPLRAFPGEAGGRTEAEAFEAHASGVYVRARELLVLDAWPAVPGVLEPRWVRAVCELVELFANWELEAERTWIANRLRELLESGEPVDQELLDAARVLFEPEP